MRLQTKEFSEACKTILFAIDTKEASLYNETLELQTSGNNLFLGVTNREYYVSVKFDLGQEEQFHASVSAKLFLNLISKITSEDIYLTIENNYVKIKGNGEYKLPIIYNNDVMLELPKITLENVTNEMTIPSDILQSILVNNSKELLRGKITKEAQKYYYIDEQGCITFVSGACVNSFTLPSSVKMLLSDKVVKLMKLFKDCDNVKFKMSQDPVSEDLVQTKVSFEIDNVILKAKLPDNSIISSVPATDIRALANKTFPYNVVLDKRVLSEILNRLMLFTEEKNYGYFDFTKDTLTISDFSKDNKEVLPLTSECNGLDTYSIILNLNNLKLIIDGCEDEYLTMCFGDNRSVLIKKNNISDLLPELHYAG